LVEKSPLSEECGEGARRPRGCCVDGEPGALDEDGTQEVDLDRSYGYEGSERFFEAAGVFFGGAVRLQCEVDLCAAELGGECRKIGGS